jgi:hypothetical protein
VAPPRVLLAPEGKADASFFFRGKGGQPSAMFKMGFLAAPPILRFFRVFHG